MTEAGRFLSSSPSLGGEATADNDDSKSEITTKLVQLLLRAAEKAQPPLCLSVIFICATVVVVVVVHYWAPKTCQTDVYSTPIARE